MYVFQDMDYSYTLFEVPMPENVNLTYLGDDFQALAANPLSAGGNSWNKVHDYYKRFQFSADNRYSFFASDRYGFSVLKHPMD